MGGNEFTKPDSLFSKKEREAITEELRRMESTALGLVRAEPYRCEEIVQSFVEQADEFLLQRCSMRKRKTLRIGLCAAAVCAGIVIVSFFAPIPTFLVLLAIPMTFGILGAALHYL